MKFQKRNHGWPLQGGRVFVPAGTIIDTDANADAWSRLVTELGLTRPPINAQPLDQATYDLMSPRSYAAGWARLRPEFE
jgi:hypothetical protein